jgi:hypothetical protein
VVAFLELVIVVVRIRGQIRQVTIVGFRVVPVVSVPFFRVDRTDGRAGGFAQLP